MIHEIAHVLLHPKRATYIHFEHSKSVGDNADRQEDAADQFAQNIFLSDSQRCELVLLTTATELQRFAQNVGVSAGVVAGQYGHYTGNWSRFGKLRESVDLATVLEASADRQR